MMKFFEISKKQNTPLTLFGIVIAGEIDSKFQLTFSMSVSGT